MFDDAPAIYNNSMKPAIAVGWPGLWNLLGMLISSGTAAFSVLALPPVELILNIGSSAGFAKIVSLLLSATIWNLGTWHFGLPAACSHTPIGSILGAGFANTMMNQESKSGDGVSWTDDAGRGILGLGIIGSVALAPSADQWYKRPRICCAVLETDG